MSASILELVRGNLGTSGSMHFMNPTGMQAQAIDAIDTTDVGSDTKFTILIPTAAGGEHDSNAVTIFLDADQTTNPVEGTDEIHANQALVDLVKSNFNN